MPASEKRYDMIFFPFVIPDDSISLNHRNSQRVTSLAFQMFPRSVRLGARTLLVAPGLTASKKKLLGTRASLIVTKGITTRSKPLLAASSY